MEKIIILVLLVIGSFLLGISTSRMIQELQGVDTKNGLTCALISVLCFGFIGLITKR